MLSQEQLQSEAGRLGLDVTTPKTITPTERIASWRQAAAKKEPQKQAGGYAGRAQSAQPFLERIGTGVKEAFGRHQEVAKEATEAYIQDKQSLLKTANQVFGSQFAFAGESVFEVIKSAFNQLPEEKQEKIKTTAGTIMSDIVGAQKERFETMKVEKPESAAKVQKLVDDFKLIAGEVEEDPSLQRDLRAAIGYTELLGWGIGKRAISSKTLDSAEGLIPPPGARPPKTPVLQTGMQKPGTDGLTATAPEKLTGLKQKGVELVERVPRAFERGAESLSEAAKKAERIKTATPEIAMAYKANLDERIVKTITEADKVTRKAQREMVQIAEGSKKKLGSATRPEIVAGKIVSNQYNLINNNRKAIGKELNAAVQKLPPTTRVSIAKELERLDYILSQQGVRFTKKGTGFTGSNFTPAQRTKVKELYKLVNELGDNVSPRKLYQRDKMFGQLKREAKFSEIGDILVETDAGTESVFNLFRKVFNEKLDSISPEIKDINTRYGEAKRLLDDIEDTILKTGKLNATKGMDLAKVAQTRLRRLSSDAQSAAEYREIVELMEEYAKQIGYDGASSVELNDFANALRDIYPTSIPKTSFTGITKPSILNIIDKTLQAGSPDFRDQQKAIRVLLGLEKVPSDFKKAAVPQTAGGAEKISDLPVNKHAMVENISDTDSSFLLGNPAFFESEADRWIRGVEYEGKQNAYDYATRDFPELGDALRKEFFGENLPKKIKAYRVGGTSAGIDSFFPRRSQAESYAKRFDVSEVDEYIIKTDNILPSTSGSGEFWAVEDDIVRSVVPQTAPEAKGTDDLLQKARKFDTFEEFLSAQLRVHHGTDKDFDKIDLSKTKDGFFVSPNIETAKGFGGKIKEFRLDSSAKVKEFVSVEDYWKWRTTDDVKNYDAVRVIAKKGDKTGTTFVKKDTDYIQVFNPEAIKTKSQLEQIFKESRSKGKLEQVNDFLSRRMGLSVEDVNKSVAYFEKGDLTLKTLKKLQGKVKVSKQFIRDLTNRGDIKQGERDLLRRVLDDMPEGKINVQEFADKVKTELIPLKTNLPQTGPSLLGGAQMVGFEHVSLSDDIRGNVANYLEKIYESPIQTSAGEVHYKGETFNYFAHSRIEDMALSEKEFAVVKKELGKAPKTLREHGKTRRVIEIQSDLFQKGALEQETRGLTTGKYRYQTADILDGEEFGFKELDEGINKDYFRGKNFDGYETTELTEKGAEKLNKLEDDRIKEVAQLQPYRNVWHERIIKEEIKQAAIDGKTKLQFPTGDTAMKIEGLGQNSNWYISGRRLAKDDLKVGAEIKNWQPAHTTSEGGWIITEVLDDGQFRAVPKSVFDDIAEGRELSIQDFVSEMRDAEATRFEEQFDISGNLTEKKLVTRFNKAKEEFGIDSREAKEANRLLTIFKFYDKDIQKYLRKKYNAKPITDEKGVTWVEVPIKKDMAKFPVEAFGIVGLPLVEDD